jgi:hypothetical protein
MKIGKHHIIDMLKGRGHHDHAAEAEEHLPDEVDYDEHQDSLSRWGVSYDDAVGASKLGVGRFGL